jgi:hypothetical protein
MSDAKLTNGLSVEEIAPIQLRPPLPSSGLLFALLAFSLSVIVFFFYRPLSQAEVGDPAIYDYIAQTILRGGLPYRDVVDIKGPGAPYLSALAMAIGKLAGLRDLIAVRLLNVLLVGLLSAITFLVAKIYLRSHIAALIAFLVPLMRDQFAAFMNGGTQPKLPMILFGMASLLMIANNRPFWAGFCSMLACLCWQPGLMFTGVALLIFSRYLTIGSRSRAPELRAACKVLAGAAIPLAGVLLYFHWRGALGELWAWTIVYNYSVFAPDAERALGDAFAHLWKIMRRTFEADIILVMMSVLGLVMFAFERVRAKLSGELSCWPDAILIPPLVYLLFSVINFQGGPDLIPFFPFIGIFAGWAFVWMGRLVKPHAITVAGRLKINSRDLIPATALAAIFALAFFRAITFKPQGWSLSDQDKAMKAISELLGPDDKIYVHGTVEILALTGRPNLNPYVFLDWGADDFAASRRHSTFKAIIEEMESQAPKLVAISRLRKVYHREEFEHWVNEHYDRLELFKYDKLYIRKKQCLSKSR